MTLCAQVGLPWLHCDATDHLDARDSGPSQRATARSLSSPSATIAVIVVATIVLLGVRRILLRRRERYTGDETDAD